MKSILNPRTMRVALARANKRLAEIETAMAELQAERETVNQLRAALFGQLGLPMPLTGVEPEPETPTTLVESSDCFWATGAHQHRFTDDKWICLAPEEQRRKPCLVEAGTTASDVEEAAS